MRGVAAGVLVLAVAGDARAFAVSQSNGHDIQWSTSDVEYWLDAAGAPDLGAAALDPVRAGAATWNAVPCSSLDLTDAGTVTGATPFLVSNERDGRNLVSWVTSGWPYDASTLAVTTPVYSVTTGVIVEADIAMNGNISWTTVVPMTTAIDVQSVATHELGHLFGLQHVLEGDRLRPPPTMAPHIDPTGGTRVPKQDDINGICYLYPATTYACASIDDCPYILASSDGAESYTGRIACTDAVCSGLVPVDFTPGALGSPCDSAADCNTGLTCSPFGSSGYCTQVCTLGSTMSCPSGFTCLSLGATSSGACFPSAAAQACTCDTTSACDAACPCDPDCSCSCNTTSGCDDGCDCDPDCDGGGCAAGLASDGSDDQGAGTALLFAAFVYVFARSKRPRHGGARSDDV